MGISRRSKEYDPEAHLGNELSIRHWSAGQVNNVACEIKGMLDKVILCSLPGQRARLRRKDNKTLFRLIARIGFFDYHQTNTGRSCYLYQIVMYLRKGWREYFRGRVCKKGELEIHHLDHDHTNDSPENLTYVTPYENKMLAACVKGGFYFGIVVKERIGNLKNFLRLIDQTRLATINRLVHLNNTFFV